PTITASNKCTIRAWLALLVFRIVALFVLAAACQPKQPLQPSFFTRPKDPNAPADCQATLACYDACAPRTEECLLLCDRRGHPKQVELARAVTYCSAQHGCTDLACIDERCAAELAACAPPPPIPAPSPMQPQP